MPLVQWFLDENNDMLGIEKVSRVEKGAMKNPFVLLSDVESEVKLSTDSYKQWVSGPLAIPMRGVVRLGKRADGSEFFYNAFITAADIEKAMIKFFADGADNKTNLHHNNETIEEDYVVESWIKMSENDKSVTLFPGENYPIGTWFLTYYIKDKEKFMRIVSGEEKTKCFSLEAHFGMKIITDPIEKQKIESQLLSVIDNNITKENLKQTKINTMKKFENIKLTDLVTAEGKVLVIDDMTYAVFIDGQLAGDGQYLLMDGSAALVQGGVLVAITPAPIPVMASEIIKDEIKKDEEEKNPLTSIINDENKNADENTTPTTQTLAEQTIVELSTQDLVKQIEELKTSLSVLNGEFTAIKNQNIELSETNAKLSKLPTAERLNNGMANLSAAEIQIDHAKFAELPMWEQQVIIAENRLSQK